MVKMQRPDYIPQDYKLIEVVDGLDDFHAATFESANMILEPGAVVLRGDFVALREYMREAAFGAGFYEVDEAEFRAMRKHMPDTLLEPADCILRDFAEHGPYFNSLALRTVSPRGYGKKEFYTFHVDGPGTDPVSGRLMIPYTGGVTQGLRNDQAVPCGHRAYMPTSDAQSFAPRLGDRWRQAGETEPAGDSDVATVPGYIHRTDMDGLTHLVMVGDNKYRSSKRAGISR